MQLAQQVPTHPNRPALRVLNNSQLQEQLDARRAAEEAAAQGALQEQAVSNLSMYVDRLYNVFANHRSTQAGWSDRLLHSLRVFNGQYDVQKLAAIRIFGGSEIYARLIAMKCRGATSLLRDVYLGAERPWGIGAPTDPDVPEEITAAIQQLVMMELYKLKAMGQPIDIDAARDRGKALYMAARDAEKANAAKRAKLAEEKIEEIFQEGGLYQAFAEFLVDLPMFPFACIKGPEVRMANKVTYTNGAATVSILPKLYWQRVSPFDLYWTPGASTIEQADVIERLRVTRAELNDCLDLPGFNVAEVRAVLDEYGRGGIVDNWDYTDTERAQWENRENPQWNQSGMLNMRKFTGNVQGSMLIEYGMTDPVIAQDPLRDYRVELWQIGTHVIKCQLTPTSRQRHPYYVTSFEKVPGTPVGNGLPDILSDLEDMTNASLRALVNNMAMASGPQVVVMDDRITPGADGDNIYPWKRWHVQSDPAGGAGGVGNQPIFFFQPDSRAAELMGVYEKFSAIADEISAIPKYMAGQGMGSGAGRTASGLAMLMGNASKILQTVAANIDRDIFYPLLKVLYDMMLVTDEQGLFIGDENIEIKGVNVAIQRETERSRQLEFAQITNNPGDQAIMGMKGRATLLRSLSNNIGLDGESVIPSEEEIDAVLAQQAMMAAQQQVDPATGQPLNPAEDPNAAAAAQGNQAPQGGNVTGDMGPRTNIAGGAG